MPPDRPPQKDIDLEPRAYRVTDAPREPRQPIFKPGGLKFVLMFIGVVFLMALWKTYGP